ncbi:betaine-aldehyde dehydrogenase [Mycolicibacterium litorale]|nr:betaine-aldehyde dehydrogenase [Mycolicibacterium litorale]
MALEFLHPMVQSILSDVEASLLIDGAWNTGSGRTFEIVDPSTAVPIAVVDDASDADVDRAVAAARRALQADSWRRLEPRSRGRLLARLAAAIDAHADEFATLEALDNGKTVRSAKDYDVDGAVAWFEYFAGWPTRLEGSTIPTGVDRLVYTMREPVGVVGQIIPWNYPLLMAAWKLAPALAAGCTVVLKPAEETPLTALLLGALIREVGFPPGVVNIVTGHGESTGRALVRHPGVDKIAFTGSTETGRAIMADSSTDLKRLTFELGGNNPNIVLADAPIGEVGVLLADAAFANHGQNCCAGTRLFVQLPVLEEVTKVVREAARKIRVGPGLDPSSDMGPLVSARQLSRVRSLLDSARSGGAEVLVGGGAPAGLDEGFFLQPTVVSRAVDDDPVVSEEIFGPVVTILPFADVEEVTRRANATPYGLAAGIWTRDIGKAHRLAAEIAAGTVWINTYNQTNPAVPFGGFKHSGFGREQGEAVLSHYSEIKSVWVNTAI